MNARNLPGLKKALTGTALTAALLLAGCATPTPYRPAVQSEGGYHSNGYSDVRIEPNRYRVMFSGNSVTSRETVERYLLYRAAELTLQQGYDYFVLADRDTEKHTNTYVDNPGFGYGGFGGFGYGYWNPYWRYYGPYGWGGWGPYGGDPFFGNDIDVRTVERYQAMADIVLGKGPKPADNLRAFDAHAVVENLGPTIQTPERRG